MNYTLIHEHASGVTSYPFQSRSKTIAADYSEKEIAQILGVEYDESGGDERLTVALVEARPLNFDALLEGHLKKQAE